MGRIRNSGAGTQSYPSGNTSPPADAGSTESSQQSSQPQPARNEPSGSTNFSGGSLQKPSVAISDSNFAAPPQSSKNQDRIGQDSTWKNQPLSEIENPETSKDAKASPPSARLTTEEYINARLAEQPLSQGSAATNRFAATQADQRSEFSNAHPQLAEPPELFRIMADIDLASDAPALDRLDVATITSFLQQTAERFGQELKVNESDNSMAIVTKGGKEIPLKLDSHANPNNVASYNVNNQDITLNVNQLAKLADIRSDLKQALEASTDDQPTIDKKLQVIDELISGAIGGTMVHELSHAKQHAALQGDGERLKTWLGQAEHASHIEQSIALEQVQSKLFKMLPKIDGDMTKVSEAALKISPHLEPMNNLEGNHGAKIDQEQFFIKNLMPDKPALDEKTESAANNAVETLFDKQFNNLMADAKPIDEAELIKQIFQAAQSEGVADSPQQLEAIAHGVMERLPAALLGMEMPPALQRFDMAKTSADGNKQNLSEKELQAQNAQRATQMGVINTTDGPSNRRGPQAPAISTEERQLIDSSMQDYASLTRAKSDVGAIRESLPSEDSAGIQRSASEPPGTFLSSNDTESLDSEPGVRSEDREGLSDVNSDVNSDEPISPASSSPSSIDYASFL